MYLNKFLKYLKTEKGRAFTMHTICVASVGLFGANYVPNTIFIDKFKTLVHSYKQGEEREVPDKLTRRFEYAMGLCRCTEFERNYLKPFIAFGFDTIHIGSMKSRFGGYIGIPVNYTYDTIADIERGDIRSRDQEIDWSSEHAKILQNSLILTEIEQVFGMARSILQVKTHKLLMTSFYPPLCLLSMYATGCYINQKMRFHTRPLALRLGLYSILGIFGYGLYAFLQDFTQVYYDTSVDKELAALGPEMTAAGIQFYDKMLQKNVALRNLTGKDIYSASGNENYFLRLKSLPLTVRKGFFQLKQDEFDEANSAKLAA